MARAIWSGSISFGLLNVPVKLYSAVARRGISLREIRESDGARIRHRRVAEGTDEEVPYEKIVRRPSRSPRTTTCRSPKTRWRRWRRRRPARSRSRTSSTSTRSTRSTSTAPTTSAPPRAPRRPTRCWPGDGGRSGKVAIARFVFRNKEHLAALRAEDGVLTLTTMRFADEVVPPERARRRAPRRAAEGGQARGRDGGAADRLADQRLRPERLPRRVPRGTAVADRTQGRRQGDRRRRRPPRSRSRPRRPT